jgi:hypothetical protein
LLVDKRVDVALAANYPTKDLRKIGSVGTGRGLVPGCARKTKSNKLVDNRGNIGPGKIHLVKRLDGGHT